MQLVLDAMSGNDGMSNVHVVLYFTIDSARTHVSECMFCSRGRYSAKSKSLKSRKVGTCFILSTCSRWQLLLRLVPFIHGFRLARTHGFRTETRIASFISEQKLICEHVDHSNNAHAWYPLFCYRNCRRSIGFRKENTCRARTFNQKQKEAATISIENRWARCYDLIGTQPGSRPCQPPWS